MRTHPSGALRYTAVQAVALAIVGSAAAQLPPAAPGGELLSEARIEALPTAERKAWTRYLAASRRDRESDRRSIEAELRSVGQAEPTPAPTGANAVLTREMTEAWFQGEEARRMAAIVLSYQTPSGGWSKRLDLRTRPRRPGEGYSPEKGYVGTFDNDATTEHLRFLSLAHRAHGDERYRRPFERGLEYVLRAQFPNGCWPQVYPLQGGYHDAATYNDDVLVRILRLLREVAEGRHPLAPEPARERAAASVRRGIDCILRSQVVVDERPTVWGAQHDPLSLAPVQARSYEHASLSGGESADVMEFLMSVEDPDERVREAVHAAADWFRRTAIHGYEYEAKGGLTPREGAGPIWARFYEIGTDRPLFSNRDGVVRYSWHELEDERRYGYAWYRDDAAKVLRAYESWARRHPRAR